jgi:hypothetical protein
MIEKKNGVHCKENHKYGGMKASDAYAQAKELDWDMCANDYIIDVNATGKVTDITEDGKFEKLELPLKE